MRPISMCSSSPALSGNRDSNAVGMLPVVTPLYLIVLSTLLAEGKLLLLLNRLYDWDCEGVVSLNSGCFVFTVECILGSVGWPDLCAILTGSIIPKPAKSQGVAYYGRSEHICVISELISIYMYLSSFTVNHICTKAGALYMLLSNKQETADYRSRLTANCYKSCLLTANVVNIRGQLQIFYNEAIYLLLSTTTLWVTGQGHSPYKGEKKSFLQGDTSPWFLCQLECLPSFLCQLEYLPV